MNLFVRQKSLGPLRKTSRKPLFINIKRDYGQPLKGNEVFFKLTERNKWLCRFCVWMILPIQSKPIIRCGGKLRSCLDRKRAYSIFLTINASNS